MVDDDITALAGQLGLTAPLEDVVAWARERTDTVLGGRLDVDLAALLEGRPLIELMTRPATTETQPSPPRHEHAADDSRAPLPPVPQRPDLAARAPQDSADDLEMLDEEDLELMEDLSEDAGGGESDAPAAMSSPEWKRALADAQGE